MLSLWDKIHSPREALIKLALMGTIPPPATRPHAATIQGEDNTPESVEDLVASTHASAPYWQQTTDHWQLNRRTVNALARARIIQKYENAV